MSVFVDRETELLWKKLLPAFIGRCRYTWDHTDSCEYNHSSEYATDGATKLRIPISVEHGKSSFCNCGQGKDAKHMPRVFKPFAKLSTRIAIAPISAVPYLGCMIPEKVDVSATRVRNVASGPIIATETAAATIAPAMAAANLATAVPIPGSESTEGCGHCGATKPDLKVCARCDKVCYCNRACQKAAWKEHKKVCKR